MKLLNVLFVLMAFNALAVAEQRSPIPLWPNGAPGALGSDDKDVPTLTPYLPEAGQAT